MNFAIVSSVQLGLSSLQAMIDSGIKPKICITLKDNIALNKSGRVFFDDICKKNKIFLLKVENINQSKSIYHLKKYNIDWLFIIGWSQIAGHELVKSPSRGVIGFHPTLLPKGRGRAPIPWAIIKNIQYTGVTVFKISDGIDRGDIFLQKKIKIRKNEDATSLYLKVNEQHIYLMKKLIPKLIKDKFKLIVQDKKKATYWPKRSPTDGEINVNMSVSKAHRFIRALTHPYPGAFLRIDDKKITIWKGKITIKKTKNFCIKFKGGYIECTDWSEEPFN